MNKTLNNNQKTMKKTRKQNMNKTRNKQHENNIKHHEQQHETPQWKTTKTWSIFRLTSKRESTFPVTQVTVTNPPRYSGLYGLVEKLLPKMQKVTR